MGRVKELMQATTDDPATRTVRLRLMRPVFVREVVREDLPSYISTARFTSASQVYELFRDIVWESREMVLALHLDGKNRVICFDRVSIGSLNQSIIHPRDLYKSALLSSAAAIILIHNHPTGDPTPSSEDTEITRRLKDAGELIGIKLLDHIIIGDGSFVSFAERGIL
jgi:DNA repair protein RadC